MNAKDFSYDGEISLVQEPPKWVREMSDHYSRTGTVRNEDAARFAGQPSAGLVAEPKPEDENR